MQITIVEALKQRKRQRRKADDLRRKIAKYCVDTNIQKPTYGTVDEQFETVTGWVASHTSCIRNITKLDLAIARANLNKVVTLKVGDTNVTQPLAYWVSRRTQGLPDVERKAWEALDESKLPASETVAPLRGVGEEVLLERRLYFDPKIRDKNIDDLKAEVDAIDSALEIANATTVLEVDL